jgi:putative transposase
VYAINEHGLSERQASQMLNLSRSVFRYQSTRPDDSAIKKELLALAAQKPRWGFGMMLAFLKRNGYDWNHKRIRRVYCELHLNPRVKPRKRLPKRNPQPMVQPEHANQSSSLDFMSVCLPSGAQKKTAPK